MAGYPGLTRVADRATMDCLKQAFDLIAMQTRRIDELETQVLTLSTSTVDVESRRLVNLADPTQEQDAVTVHFLRAYVEAQAKVL